jgi:protocatechuate 3,4-dioxygenase beta subunit
VSTDEAGRFSLDAEAVDTQGHGWIDIGDATFVPQRFEVELPSRDVRLVARKGNRVSVTVLSAVGAPVRGAQVTLWKRDARGESDHSETTDANGEATLQGVPPGAYVAEALVKGQAVDASTAQPVDVQPGEAPAVTLRLEEGRVLKGTVADARGRPLPGVAVRAELLDADRPRYRAASQPMGLPPNGVRTDAQGRFRLRPLGPHRYRLIVALDEHDLDVARSQGVRPGEEDTTVQVDPGVEEVRLVLRRRPHVRGRVLVEGDAPLAAFDVNGRPYMNRDGRFDQLLSSSPGPQRLVVRAKGYASVDRTVTPEGEGDVDLGTITLSRGRTVRVMLRDAATGKPYNGRVRTDSGEWATLPMSYELHGEGVPDGPPYLQPTRTAPQQDATLLLEHAPLGAFTLELKPAAHLPLRVPVGAEQESVTVSLDAGARVSGRVRDAQGKPVAARLVFTRSDGASEHHETTARDFILHAIPPGLYTVSAHPRDAVDDTAFSVRRLSIPASGEVHLTFDALGAGATVTLRFPQDVDTAFLLAGPVPPPDSGRTLERMRYQQHPLEEWTGTSVTYRRVPAGRYTLIVSTRDRDRLHREELDVPAEGTLSRDVRPVWSPLGP